MVWTFRMNTAYFRFYAHLNHFLPNHQRKRRFAHPFNWRASIKDMIESLGIPHTEVELLLVNGNPVDFDYIVNPDDKVSVYPPFESIDISGLLSVSPEPLPVARFVVDIHLGKLAARLRLRGFDTLFPAENGDKELARISAQDERILLTRDTGLLKRGAVRYGCYVHATTCQEQIVEVLRRYDLFAQLAPFTRCVRCNGLLHAVPKEDVIDDLPPRTQEYYDEFQRCASCDRIYWKGSHFNRIMRFIDSIIQQPQPETIY